MSAHQYTPARDNAQPIAEVVSVAAEGRLNTDPNSRAQSFIDVTLYFLPGGSLTIQGWAVLHESGKEPIVLPPGRKGERRYFPIVSLSGDIRRVIEQAVLKEYTRLRSAAE